MDSVTTVDNAEDYPKILHGAGSLETATAGTRRHVVTFADTWVPGEPEAHLLPAECKKGKTAAFRIPIGPRPQKGTAQVYLGLGENGVPGHLGDGGPREQYVMRVRARPRSLRRSIPSSKRPLDLISLPLPFTMDITW